MNMFKIISLLICLIFILGYKVSSVNYNSNLKLGKYSHIHFSIFKKAYLYINGVRHLPISDTLIINSDKTFEIKYCNGNNSGNWEIINDTLRIYYYVNDKFVNRDFKICNDRIIQIYNDKSWYGEYKIAL